MRTASLMLLPLFALLASPVNAAIYNVEIVTPRAFGYVIGDVIEHTISIELEQGYRLDRDSLPEAGRLNRWLELRSPRLSIDEDNDSTHYEISLIYQILNSSEKLKQIFVPNYTLIVTDREHSLPVLIPEWGFTIAPITKIDETTSAAFLDIQRERPPPTISLTPHVTWLVVTGLVILPGLFFLAYVYADIPFLKRTKGPFALACRQLKRLENKPYDPTVYREALRRTHHALNQTADAVLFADELDAFFSSHSKYIGERDAIEKLFEQSRSAFFEPAESGDARPHSLHWLVRLCRRCRDLERGLT